MLRNRELRRFAAAFLALAVLSAALGFRIGSAAGALAFGSAAAFGALFFTFTRARYRRIAQMSEQIDLVLHNADRLFIAGCEEGELSILQSEIAKMTRRIRLQNEALKREKAFLADSLADIAHQLRTPLTSLNLILTLLADAPDEGGRRELTQEGEGLLRRMDWLLTALLRLSRLDAGIVELQNVPFTVTALVDAALKPLLIPLELHGIAVRREIPEVAAMRGDLGWLAEALQNILKNCMESVGEGGRIEIACADTPLYLELTVHDNGPGFAPEDLPSLFDRFYRGKGAAASGHGVGLALCRTIVVRQGGTISAKNHPQGGALFSLCFPK